MENGYTLDNGYINNRYEIILVTATYENDQENVPGVSRLTDLSIKVEGDIPIKLKEKVSMDAFNVLCETQYFDASSGWQDEAKKEIANYLSISPSIIEIL